MFNLSKHVIKAATLTVSVALLSACGGSDDNTPSAMSKTQPIHIEFVAMAGADRINCGQIINTLGTTSTSAKLRDLRFYLSDLHLIDANDHEVPINLSRNEWQHAGVVLIDLEDGADICGEAGGNAAMNAQIVGTVPEGIYTGIGYTVGVPLTLNHSDTHAQAAPLDVQAMSWAWQGGRKFIKLEVNPINGVTRPAQTNADGYETPAKNQSTFNIHLGATGCSGSNPSTGLVDTCERPNRMAYHSHAFNADTQRIAVDIQSLLASSDISQDLSGPYGCMSGVTDPECAAIFAQLNINLTTGQPMDGGHDQGLFKVVPKAGALASNGTTNTTPVIVVDDHRQHNASVE